MQIGMQKGEEIILAGHENDFGKREDKLDWDLGRTMLKIVAVCW